MVKFFKVCFFKFFGFVFDKIPVDKQMIILESNPSYMDNTGVLFEEMLKHNLNEKYKFIWLVFDGNTKKENTIWKEINVSYDYRKTKLGRFCSILKINYYYARAKYNIHSHRNYYIFKPKIDQVIVNLSHGTPLKDSSGRHASQKYVDYIVSTSRYAQKLRSQTYDDFNGKFLITGFPRNDKFDKQIKPDRVIFWLPTYRNHKSSLTKNQFETFPLGMNEEKFRILDNFLIENDYKLIVKPHPAQKLEIFDELNNIKFINDTDLVKNNIHLYEILNRSQILITDYSSVYLDYLLLNRPIIFVFDDLELYSSDPGFLVEDFKEYAPGIHVYKFNQLLDSFNKLIKNREDEYYSQREKVSALFNDFSDKKNSERVLREIGLI